MKRFFSKWGLATAFVTGSLVLGRGPRTAEAQSATTPAPAPNATVNPVQDQLPYGLSEVVKMQQAGVDKKTIIDYVNSTAVPYQLTAEQKAQLKATGLPDEVISAIVARGVLLQKEQEVPPPVTMVANGDWVYPDDAYYYPYWDGSYAWGWPYYYGPWIGGYYRYGYGYHGYGYHGYFGYHGGFGGGFRGGFRGGGHGGGHR